MGSSRLRTVAWLDLKCENETRVLRSKGVNNSLSNEERYVVLLNTLYCDDGKERERVLLSMNLKMLLDSSLDREEAGKESESGQDAHMCIWYFNCPIVGEVLLNEKTTLIEPVVGNGQYKSRLVEE